MTESSVNDHHEQIQDYNDEEDCEAKEAVGGNKTRNSTQWELRGHLHETMEHPRDPPV